MQRKSSCGALLSVYLCTSSRLFQIYCSSTKACDLLNGYCGSPEGPLLIHGLKNSSLDKDQKTRTGQKGLNYLGEREIAISLISGIYVDTNFVCLASFIHHKPYNC